MIEDVTIFAEPRQPDVRLGLRWRNCYSEEIRVTKPLPNWMARKHTQETVDLIRKLAANLTDSQIVDRLNESGLHTPEGRRFTVKSIKWIRHKNQIPTLSMQPKGLSVKETASYFNVGTATVYHWIKQGVLEAKQVAPGWPFVIQMDTEKEVEVWERIEKSGHLSKKIVR